MKLTTRQLRQIIREEVQNVALRRRRISEMAKVGGMDSKTRAQGSNMAGKMVWAAQEAFRGSPRWRDIELLADQAFQGFEDANPNGAIRGLEGLTMLLDELGEEEFIESYVVPLQRLLDLA